LKILASERGRVFSTDELIEYLWPDDDLRSAASNLRGRIAELRKILEPSLGRGERSRYIVTQRGGYVLGGGSDCWVDAEEFARAEEQGRRAYGEGRFDEARESLERAVALYRGEYLAEDRYEEWAVHARERWRERFVEVLSLLADCLARRGEYRVALGYLERAAEESPVHEVLYRQMMIYSFCAGDRGRAHRAYERCRAVLERELGERPSSQTEEIFRQIRAEAVPDIGRVYPSLREGDLLPMKMRRPPFVGRAREWDALASALAKARSGAGRVVLIFGEAGVGKTRLGEEFLRWAHEETGAPVLCGRCYELENPLPLHLWIEAVREGIMRLNGADLAGVPPAWLAELSEILPQLRRLFPDLSPVALPPEHRQYRIFETLYHILSALARHHAPLLVLVDDLQWADSLSLDFLCYLIERIANEPMLILGTARGEELGREHGVERVRHQGVRLGRLDEIHLQCLEESEIYDLVQELADEVETTADFGGRLYRESIGNPLFVTAVLQALFENGAFVREGARWRLADPSRIALAPSAVQLLERRVKRVSTTAQRVLHLVACAVQIELEVLEAAWEGTSQELFAHLAELTAQGLLIERGGRYEFVHDKFRTVVYDHLEEPRRIWLHRRIAHALERVYADPVAAGLAGQLAEHYERGGQLVQALEWVLQAVQDHRRRYRHEEGLAAVTKGFGLLQTVAARLPESTCKEFEYQLLEHRINLHLHLGLLTEIETDLDRLAELAQRDPQRQGRMHLLRADYYERVGRHREHLEAAQQALRFLQGDPQGEIRALREQSLAYYYLGDLEQARAGFHKIADTAADPEERLTALENLALICRKHGDIPQAHHYLNMALHLATASNLLEKESDLWYTRGMLEWYTGHYQDALHSFHKAHQICLSTGDLYGMAYALLNISMTLSSVGDYQQALQSARESERLFIQLNNSNAHATTKRLLAHIFTALGEQALARQCAEEALQLSSSDPRRQGECLAALAEVLLTQGQLQRAHEYAHQALAIAQHAQTPYPRVRVTLAKILLATGDAAGALEQSQQALAELSACGGEGVIHAYYQHYRALQALNHPEAPHALRKAYDELQRTANQITDDFLRTSFLNIPLHREILSLGLDTTPRPCYDT
jgi:predicted ATPase/DNA-binding SARP family transcriptional activator